LREADLEADWKEIRSWIERLAPLLSTPQAQLQERGKEIARALQDSHATAEERSRLTLENLAIRDALRPETAPAVALLRGLTAAQVAQLRRDENLLLSRENGTLPPA